MQNSMNSTSRSTSESSTMMPANQGNAAMNTQAIQGDIYEGMGLSRILECARLTGAVREFFESYANSAEDADALQTSVFISTFKAALDSGLYQQFSAQKVIKSVCATLVEIDGGCIDATTPTDWRMYRNIAKRFIQAWHADGWLEYQPEIPTRSEDKKIPAYYVLNSKMLKRSIQHLLHDEPCIMRRYIKPGTVHEEGALAMSSHKFSINVERAKECSEFLAKGYFLNKKGFWQMADDKNHREIAKLQQQREALAQARIAYAMKPSGWYYQVKADSRGRLYYVSGMLNPQSGGVAYYILTTDNQVTYDSTASFAQFISIVTGDRHLADACNLLNYTGTARDFYGNVYALASGLPCPAKDSFEREVAKQYLMPKAYGSSDEASRERAVQMAKEAGHDPEVAAAIVDVLTTYGGLNVLKDAASNAALRLAAKGKQLSWVTPSGFTVTQDYWVTVSEEWNTGEKGNEYIPTRVTFKERTDVVKVDRTEEDSRSAVVAAAANFIQSLDAALMAMIQARFYKETGSTIIGIHDSFTFDKEHEETFKAIAWQAFYDLAHSEELKEMRDVIGLPQKDLIWLNPKRIPHFIDKE